MAVAPSTHLRLEFDGKKMNLAAFDGSVEAAARRGHNRG